MKPAKTEHRCAHCGQHAHVHWRVEEPQFALGVSTCGCDAPEVLVRGDPALLIRWLEEQEGPEIAALIATLRTMFAT